MQTFSKCSYEPPEYYIADLRGKLTEKSDVFSFGVVLLELITGKFAILGDDERLVNWVCTFFFKLPV